MAKDFYIKAGSGGGGGSTSWGSITGTLSSQTDLQAALDAKMTTATYDTDADGIVDNAERIPIIVRNSTGSTLTKGQIVYLSGATGNRPNALLAKADAEATSSKTIGMVMANIANNTDGNVAVNGTLHDIDTSAFAAGDSLWLSATTAGAMVANTPPAEPNHAVFIGYVARAHPTLGRIILNVQNGYELDELHGVQITSVADNNILQYDSTSGLWKNESLSTAGIQPTLVSGTNIKTINSTSLLGSGDIALMDLTSNQNVSGTKTFVNNVVMSNGTTITPPTGSGASNVGVIVSGSNTNGGTNYLDFLKATNTAVGATNPNKYFRLNSTGSMEIVNSAYSGTIFSLTDTGVLNGATPTEMGYLSGVTSSIQTQLDAKGYALAGNLNGGTVGLGVTTYIGFGIQTINGIETQRRSVVSAGTVKGVYLRTNASMTGTLVLTVMKNGSATSMTFTIATGSAAGLYSTTSNSFSVADGDEISIRIAQSTAISAALYGFGITVR